VIKNCDWRRQRCKQLYFYRTVYYFPNTDRWGGRAALYRKTSFLPVHAKPIFGIVGTSSRMSSIYKLEMWANAQRDGRHTLRHKMIFAVLDVW